MAILRFLGATALFVPSLLTAQETEPTMHVPPPSHDERFVRGAFGFDFTNQYFFRGIQQENQGIIVQPWAELGYDLVDPNESLRRLDLRFGLWNSLHDGPTGGADGIWYESDFYVDLTAGIGDRWSAGVRYTAYTSPNDTFVPAARSGFRETVQELAFTVGFDDKALLLDTPVSGLQPYGKLAFELDGQRDNGLIGNEGIYAEIGIRPSFSLEPDDSEGLRLELPVRMGFSLGDYYEDNQGGNDDFFGYLDVGAEVVAPMTFLPRRMGPWRAHAGLHWLLLGDNLEERNAGDTGELIFSIGVATSW